MTEVYERIVDEAMARMRWTRKKAETAAQKLMKRVKPQAIIRKLDALDPPMEPRKPTKLLTPGKTKKLKNQPKPMTRGQIAKLPPVRPRPKTAKERLERAMGPDDGRRRGGSPTVQGGSPRLGKRR